MNEDFQQNSGIRYILIVVGLVIVVAGMRAAEAIIVPLLFSAFLAIIISTPVFWLRRKRVPDLAAVFLVVLGLLALGLGFAALIGTSLQDFSEALPRYQALLTKEIAPLLHWVQGLGIELSEETFLQYVDPGASMRLVANMLSGLGAILTNTFLILLTVIFILLEASSFPIKMEMAFDDPKGASQKFSKLTTAINHYLGIKTVMSLGTGVTVTLFVALFGIDFPLIWGLLAFLLNYIPNLGSIIAAVPAVLLGYLQFGLGQALLVGLGYALINIIFGNLIEPRLMGRKLGLSTLVVFLSLVFWGWVWGPVGMLLSVPMTMVAKIALEGSASTQWIGILMDSESAIAKVPPQ